MKLEKLLTAVSNAMVVIGFIIILCAASIDDFYTFQYKSYPFSDTVLLMTLGALMFVPKVIEMILDCWED